MDFSNAIKQQTGKIPEIEVGHANIKVIGAGGAGSNMVSWLFKKGIKGAETICCNTDLQHLNMIEADRKFLIGKTVTRGLGCGGFPSKGAEAAQETLNEIKDTI
ncbi:MAG: cell division protein FtsZ, partial [Nanoarchaeota archaeon]